MIAPTDISTVNSHKDLVDVECPCFSEERLWPNEAVRSWVFTSARWARGGLAPPCEGQSRPVVVQSYRSFQWSLRKLFAEVTAGVGSASAWPLWTPPQDAEVETPVILEFKPAKTFTFSFVLDSYVRVSPNVVVD
jgi:hypothetical protein